MEKNFLKNVYGWKKVKEELEIIQDWIKKYCNDDEKKRFLPKGILFYGYSGSGKTHLLREYAKSFNFPIYVVEGKENEIEKEIIETYKKARKENSAIVLIDELDRLIENDPKLVRVLQTQLDGFEINTNILTLATANEIDCIPEPLKREGRFDRRFRISYPDKDDLSEIIPEFAKNCFINLSQEEINRLIDEFAHHYTCSELKSIFSNASLRYGEKCTVKNLIDVGDFLDTGLINKDENYKVSLNTALHEAGHALYLYKFCKTRTFLRICFNNGDGRTFSNDTIENPSSSYDNLIEHIRVALAGPITEKIFLKNYGVGSTSDFKKAFDTAHSMMSEMGTKYINNLQTYEEDREPLLIPFSKKEIQNRRTNMLIKKESRIVKRQLNKYKNRKVLLEIARFLQEHKEMSKKELIDLMNKLEKDPSYLKNRLNIKKQLICSKNVENKSFSLVNFRKNGK